MPSVYGQYVRIISKKSIGLCAATFDTRCAGRQFEGSLLWCDQRIEGYESELSRLCVAQPVLQCIANMPYTRNDKPSVFPASGHRNGKGTGSANGIDENNTANNDNDHDDEDDDDDNNSCHNNCIHIKNHNDSCTRTCYRRSVIFDAINCNIENHSDFINTNNRKTSTKEITKTSR